jgi:hypothetical protein
MTVFGHSDEGRSLSSLCGMKYFSGTVTIRSVCSLDTGVKSPMLQLVGRVTLTKKLGKLVTGSGTMLRSEISRQNTKTHQICLPEKLSHRSRK